MNFFDTTNMDGDRVGLYITNNMDELFQHKHSGKSERIRNAIALQL